MSMELSVSETNKLRLQLGLPLIPEEKAVEATQNASQASAEEHTQTSAEEDTQATDKATANSKPLITYDDYDTSAWLDSLGKAPETEGTVQEQRVPEKAQYVVQHSEEELASLRGGDILHLQDGGVIDDNDDVLVNEELARKQKARENEHERQNLQKLSFGKGTAAAPEQGSVVFDGDTIKLEKTDDETREDVPARAVFKKPKKPKSSKKRQREPDLLPEDVMFTALLETEDVDDGLEEALSQSLQKKRAKRQVKTAEEVANEVEMHQRIDLLESAEGMVYDHTRDFLGSLEAGAEKGTRGTEGDETGTEGDETGTKGSETGTETRTQGEGSHEGTQERTQGPLTLSLPEETSADGSVERKISENGYESDPPSNISESKKATENHFGSLLSTLKYLRKNTDTAQNHKDKEMRERRKEAELARLKIRIEERFLAQELQSNPGYNSLEKEERDKIFDRELNLRLVEKGIVEAARGPYALYAGAHPLKDYDPEVNVKYQDARGHSLSVKEAWKELLHKYHGLAPKKKKEREGPKSTAEKVVR